MDEDRHGENRLVLLLGQVREELEARVEVRLRRDHHRRALGGGGAGDPLARAHARPARHLLDARPVGGAQHELVAPLVVEVHEACVRVERVGDLRRHEVEHLFEVEGRVDGRNRLRQQPKVPLGGVHAPYRRERPPMEHWLLFFHLVGAFCFFAGAAVAGTLQLAAIRRERPSEIVALLRLTRAGVALVGVGALLTLGFGIGLAEHLGLGLSPAWIQASLGLWLASMALGGTRRADGPPRAPPRRAARSRGRRAERGAALARGPPALALGELPQHRPARRDRRADGLAAVGGLRAGLTNLLPRPGSSLAGHE